MDSRFSDINNCNCVNCGRNLGCEQYLYRYKYEFLPTVESYSPQEKAAATKKFFREELFLYSPCCWKKLQTNYDCMPIALLNADK